MKGVVLDFNEFGNEEREILLKFQNLDELEIRSFIKLCEPYYS